jgi:hypothetical protein
MSDDYNWAELLTAINLVADTFPGARLALVIAVGLVVRFLADLLGGAASLAGRPGRRLALCSWPYWSQKRKGHPPCGARLRIRANPSPPLSPCRSFPNDLPSR